MKTPAGLTAYTGYVAANAATTAITTYPVRDAIHVLMVLPPEVDEVITVLCFPRTPP